MTLSVRCSLSIFTDIQAESRRGDQVGTALLVSRTKWMNVLVCFLAFCCIVGLSEEDEIQV